MEKNESLISDDYRNLQTQLHEDKPEYGTRSIQYAPIVNNFINQFKVRNLLDYGAGKGRLAQGLKPAQPLTVHLYEPAIEKWSDQPEPCEFVCCIDVLEHIEPDLLDNVLDDLKRVTVGHGLYTIDCGPAIKVLSDGRNAHLIQEPPTWWLPKIMERFELLQYNKTGDKQFLVLVKALA